MTFSPSKVNTVPQLLPFTFL